MWQQFLIGVLGTALGVGLTFGLNGMLERSKQEQAKRLTAIMVIHDIDNTIDQLKSWREDEEEANEFLQYVVGQKERLDMMPYDTLSRAINMLLNQGSEFHFDTSKEKIFNSDLDTWQTLGNMKFMDNVQAFFYDRSSFQDRVNMRPEWRAPIPSDEFMQLFMGIGWVTQEQYCELAWPFLKEKLNEKHVSYFIDVAPYRVHALNGFIDYWTRLNEENKFLMGITDRELDDYVNSINVNGEAVTRRSLVGAWVLSRENARKEYVFDSDHSFTLEEHESEKDRWLNWSGELRTTMTYSGKWEMTGDSLILTIDRHSYGIDLDISGLVPEEGMRDSLERWKNHSYEQSMKAVDDMPEESLRHAYKARLDSSKDKMEWTYPTGEAVYLKRKDN